VKQGWRRRRRRRPYPTVQDRWRVDELTYYISSLSFSFALALATALSFSFALATAFSFSFTLAAALSFSFSFSFSFALSFSFSFSFALELKESENVLGFCQRRILFPSEQEYRGVAYLASLAAWITAITAVGSILQNFTHSLCDTSFVSSRLRLGTCQVERNECIGVTDH
jgi:hypothetical protein